MGRLWYEKRQATDKKNTFTDFIAVGRHLVTRDLLPSSSWWHWG